MRLSQVLIYTFVICLVAFTNAVLSPAVLSSDILELSSSVTIDGKILNSTESPRKTWRVQMAEGVIVELPHKAGTSRQVMQPQAMQQYYAKVPFLPETVETHLKLAEVCMTQNLVSLGNLHYQRVLDIDPENLKARNALNYRKINGQWVTLEEEMLRQGYVKTSRGIWTTAQKLMIDERRVQLGQDYREPSPVVQNLIAQFKANPSQETEDGLLNLTDPEAVPALADALKNEPNPSCRNIYVRTLAQIGTGPAFREIAQCAMREKDENVVRVCIVAMQNTPAISKLFVQFLANQDNTTVNRAAYIIGQLNDRTAIPALINALMTQHDIAVSRVDPNLAQFAGTGNHSFGSQQVLRPKTEIVFISNPEVLGALRKLTGMDFEYEVVAWWNWWAGQNQIVDFDARRGSRD
ncbi:MAG: hypothetical protein FWD31_01805 [Planctomycetaceae bacterium]|nr:hypothetical protein [Planctomycetaceae bacterium]